MEQRPFFGLSEHLERLSQIGDPLEVLEKAVDFEYFRGGLVEGLGYGDGAKSGRRREDFDFRGRGEAVWLARPIVVPHETLVEDETAARLVMRPQDLSEPLLLRGRPFRLDDVGHDLAQDVEVFSLLGHPLFLLCLAPAPHVRTIRAHVVLTSAPRWAHVRISRSRRRSRAKRPVHPQAAR